MYSDRRKPWSRTGSVLSTRWASFQVNPDPAPTPDPQPPPDDDDDDLQVWAGGNDIDKNPSAELFIQALGDAECGGTGECWSGLFAETRRYDHPYEVTGSPSGSVPPRVGRQAARPFSADKGGDPFNVFMLAPRDETVGRVSSDLCYHHLYFAWLDHAQYAALCNEVDARSAWPRHDIDNHKMLWFAEQPQFRIKQPYVETWGTLNVKTDPSISWDKVRVTLFGIVGPSHTGTPRTWAWSQPAKQVDALWKFGKPHCPTFEGVDGWPQAGDVMEVFVVGWGTYWLNGNLHAAVTPPLCAGSYCYRSGVGDWTRGAPLPDGDLTPAKWQELSRGIKDDKDTATCC